MKLPSLPDLLTDGPSTPLKAPPPQHTACGQCFSLKKAKKVHMTQFDQRGSYTKLPARAKYFTNYVFCHPQFGGVIQNIENHCAITAKF